MKTGGLGSFFQVVVAAYQYGSKKGKAKAAMNRQQMIAEYEFRKAEVERVRAETAEKMMQLETKTIVSQAAAARSLKEAEAAFADIEEVVNQRRIAEFTLLAGGAALVVLGVVLVRRKKRK